MLTIDGMLRLQNRPLKMLFEHYCCPGYTRSRLWYNAKGKIGLGLFFSKPNPIVVNPISTLPICTALRLVKVSK